MKPELKQKPLQKSDFNNYYMAALGLSTLLLRLGAVVSLCKKLHHLDDKEDASFITGADLMVDGALHARYA